MQCPWITYPEFENSIFECGAAPGSTFYNDEVSYQVKAKYFHLHCESAATILQMIKNISAGFKLKNKINFAADTMFCRWVYVIGLDKNTFEVYTHNNLKLNKDDFFYYLTKKPYKENEAVKLLKS